MSDNPDHPSRAMAIALVFLAVIWVSPFAWLVSNAVDPLAGVQLRLPAAIGPDNFIRAMSGSAAEQFRNSLFIAAGTATLTLIVASGAAYALSRLRVPGRNAFLWSLVLLRMLPPTGIQAQAIDWLDPWVWCEPDELAPDIVPATPDAPPIDQQPLQAEADQVDSSPARSLLEGNVSLTRGDRRLKAGAERCRPPFV
jgi:hypothetical protein